MKPLLRSIAVLCGLIFLASCTTFDPPKTMGVDEINEAEQGSLSPFNWRPTEYSGKNAARAWMPNPNGDPVVVEIVGAKEQSSISMTYDPQTGLVEYKAEDVKGLSAQEFPLQADAALAKELGDLWTSLAPEIKQGVLCGLGLALGVPAAC